MALLRIGAYWLAILGFVILVADGARSIAVGELVMTSLAVMWDALRSEAPGLITIAAGGDGLAEPWRLAVTMALALPASAAALCVAVSLVLVDAAMKASYARVRHTLNRL